MRSSPLFFAGGLAAALALAGCAAEPPVPRLAQRSAQAIASVPARPRRSRLRAQRVSRQQGPQAGAARAGADRHGRAAGAGDGGGRAGLARRRRRLSGEARRQRRRRGGGRREPWRGLHELRGGPGRLASFPGPRRQSPHGRGDPVGVALAKGSRTQLRDLLGDGDGRRTERSCSGGERGFPVAVGGGDEGAAIPTSTPPAAGLAVGDMLEKPTRPAARKPSSARKVGRPILDVLCPHAVEREGRDLPGVEIELAEVDAPHPPVIQGPVMIDLVAGVGDNGPLCVAEMGNPRRSPFATGLGMSKLFTSSTRR